jgi:hypothetical protein
VLRVGKRIAHPLEQQADRGVVETSIRLTNREQGYLGRRGEVDVVRHGDTAGLQSLRHSDCQQILRRKDGVGSFGEIER